MKSRQLQNKLPIKEGKPMKPIAFLSLFAVMLLASCSTMRTGSSVYDDVYYSPSDPVVHVKEVVVTQEKVVQEEPVQEEQYYYNEEQYYADPEYQTESYLSPEGNIVNNYYFYGDYHDYSYTSRLRRFHRPMGYSYYHDYYTNMYWYNYDPHYWGTSIYIGYGYYPASFYGHYGWGWPRRSFMSAWYNPYFMWGMGYPHYYYGGYSSYWTGYRHGYWDGYYGYPNYGGGWYKNSYDQNSYYYGPRTGFAGNTGTGTVGTGGRPMTFGERYEKALAAETTTRSADQGKRGSRPDPSGEGVRGSRPATSDGGRVASDVPGGETRATQQEPGRAGTRETVTGRDPQRPAATPAEGRTTMDRPASQTRPDRSVSPNERTYQYSPPPSRQAPTQTRPDVQRQQPAQTQRQPQPYSSPRYTKPKTSEEFTSPAYRSPRETTRQAEGITPRQETSPSQQRQATPQAAPSQQRPAQQQAAPQQGQPRQQQAAPSRQQPGTQPRYTPPARSDQSRQSTPPPRQYNPPSRSTSPPPSRSATPSYTPPRSSSPPASSPPRMSSPSRSSSPPPSSSSSPSVSSPSRSSGSSAPSGGSSGSGSRSSSGSSGRGGR